MDAEIRKRLRWVKVYDQVKNHSIAALRCGISRPTLRKWVQRYEANGEAGLASRSRRPKSSPARRIGDRERAWILEFRGRRLGSRRIESELSRTHDFKVSRTTIDKVLSEADSKPLTRPRLDRKRVIRYAKEVPGERMQMDTCKIAPGRYQYTAVDDCTRIRVLALYPRRTAGNTLLFIERVIEELPFPIQRIQTDRGREFFAYSVQHRLRDYAIKFRPVKPASPHLNGKVERSQRTDLDEFYATVDLNALDLDARLSEWQDHYNHFRPHGSLGGLTPWEKWQGLARSTPCWEDVESGYDPSKERIRHPDYRIDSQLRALEQARGRQLL
jgi:transposase InsO family protein